MGDKFKNVSVRKDGHLFEFFVTKSGQIEYKIDNGKLFTAKQLKDGKVFFIQKQEVIIRNELVLLDGIELYDEDFNTLKDAQDAVLKDKQEKAMKKSRKLDVSGEATEQAAIFRMVDSWKKKVRTCKGMSGKREKCCFHDFRIGNDKYRFVERHIDDMGIVVNPDYMISKDIPGIGGVPRKYGELVFWDYLFPDEGWKRVRVLTNNEMICLDIILNFGYFASQSKHA